MMMQPAESLTKEQELELGERIQNKLSADAAYVLEGLAPVDAIANYQEDFNRGLRAMAPIARRPFTRALAQHLNTEKVAKKHAEWALAFEYFTPEDIAVLQCGWTEERKGSFNSSLEKAGYAVGSFADKPGYSEVMRKYYQHEGDNAANDLVRSNILLVHSMAHEFRRKMPSAPEHEEIFAQGMIGLWKAARKYDPRRGNKFSTVAYNWVRQSIVREVNNTYRLVRLPENRVGDYIEISKLRREVADLELSEPDFEALVSERLGLSREKIREINNAAGTHVSLNKTVGDEDGEKELMHYVAQNAPGAETVAIESEMQTILDMALAALEPLELEIVVSSFKLNHPSIGHRTVKAICEEADITPSQYRRQSAIAIKKVREYLDSYGVSFTDFFN